MATLEMIPSDIVPRGVALALAAGAVLLIGACSKGNEQRTAGESAGAAAPAAAPSTAASAGSTAAGTTSASGAMAPSGTTSAAGAAGAAGAAANASSITPQMVALGDSIFHGQAAGGLCYTCHGANAKGTQLAPDLTDKTWLNGDGSYSFIVHTVTTGVPKPKQHPGPMPPMGGAQLTPQQINSVAAYVYSLSHPNVGKSS